MAHRNLAQVVIIGTQVIGRAFVQAYKQVVVNAAQHGNSASHTSQNSQSSTSPQSNAHTRATGLTFEEACQILDFRKDEPIDKAQARYDTIFKANDPKNGIGSFYLQSKAFRAHERILLELGQKENNEPSSTTESNDTSSSNPKKEP